MTPFSRLTWLYIFLSTSLFVVLPLSAQEVLSAGPDPDGKALAQRICAMLPPADSEIHGTLEVREKKRSRRVPLVCKIVAVKSAWQSIYSAKATNGRGAETLIVVHRPYLYAHAKSPTNALPALASVSAQEAAAFSFAGSDFSLADLGLDFLHWPQQRHVEDKKRFQRICFVLDSGNDQRSGIVRVRSYIDRDYGKSLGAQGFPALLAVEAFDANER